jgi:hypothetical protein
MNAEELMKWIDMTGGKIPGLSGPGFGPHG